jgi:hypothetical protein
VTNVKPQMDSEWFAATWEGASFRQERAWSALSPGEQREAFRQMKEEVVALWRRRGHDISHILGAPDPASAEARSLGCVCPEPSVGELHMLPECPVHHYPLGFRSR